MSGIVHSKYRPKKKWSFKNSFGETSLASAPSTARKPLLEAFVITFSFKRGENGQIDLRLNLRIFAKSSTPSLKI